MDRYLDRPWVLRILSLALAVFLWSQVVGQTDPVGTRTLYAVAVHVSGLMPATRATVQPATVSVTLGGSRAVLLGVDTAQVNAQATWLAGTALAERIPVTVRVPAGLVVLRVTPARVRVLVVSTVRGGGP